MNWKVGLDEAGRGPVLGPLVIGVCSVPETDEHLLVEAGVKDSKELSPKKRKELEQWFEQNMAERDWFGTTVCLDAERIDLALQGQGLNWLEVEGFSEALSCLPMKQGVDIMADACDVNADRFTQRIAGLLENWPWPQTMLRSEHKADTNHPVVAMASILAKEERERAMERMTKRVGTGLGSGYPSDPATKAALPILCKQEGIDPDVRWGWATVVRFWQANRHGDVPLRGQPSTVQQTLFHHDRPSIS